MLELLQLTIGDVSRIWREQTASGLLVIMLPNDCLHRLGACHGCLLSHKRSDGTQRKASCTGDFPKNSRPYSVLVLHLVHDRKVLLLLVPHILPHRKGHYVRCR